jgi:hypothetical protein
VKFSASLPGWGRTMIDWTQAALPPCLAHAPASVTTSAKRRSLSGLVLACLLLAGWFILSAGPSLAASDANPSPKPDPAARSTSASGPAHAAATAVTSNPVLLQRRRQAIAQMLEGSFPFRTFFDVKLIDAKLAGPFLHKARNSLFSTETHTDTLYCAKANFDVPWIHAVGKSALIRVVETSKGSERLVARVSNDYPFECSHADYGPFPELEQARARRRKALGKTD